MTLLRAIPTSWISHGFVVHRDRVELTRVRRFWFTPWRRGQFHLASVDYEITGQLFGVDWLALREAGATLARSKKRLKGFDVLVGEACYEVRPWGGHPRRCQVRAEGKSIGLLRTEGEHIWQGITASFPDRFRLPVRVFTMFLLWDIWYPVITGRPW